MLPACPARPIGVDPQVLLADLDVEIAFKFRNDIDGSERRVPSGARIERRDADEPVDADLGLEPPVGVGADHVQRRVPDTRRLASEVIEQPRFEAVALDPALIHPKQHHRPVARLRPPCSGVDAQKGVLVVVLPTEHDLESEPRQSGFDLREVAANVFQRRRVALLRCELVEQSRVFEEAFELADRFDAGLEALHFAHARLCRVGGRPEPRALHLLFDRGDCRLGRGDVKESP